MSNKKELNPKQLEEVNGGIDVFAEDPNASQQVIDNVPYVVFENGIYPVSASDSQQASGEILAATIARRNDPMTNRNNGLRRRRPIGSRPRVKRDPLV